MAEQIRVRIIPKRATETISISCREYIDKFKKKFHSQNLKDFFIFNKTTVGNDIYLEIRSMRVNEFITMLDDFNIRWKHITENYK